ncbi:TadG family pilus assembly protein [Dechloromonas sp. A34]|uniref:TadG family pilus assembly protein n=1 Tax=Dechloromonas sp. A34 TaxID=447588 RepID=UPI0022493D2F|nr:TadG family pilus assembly protein [Dechloromonas sp. A34]
MPVQPPRRVSGASCPTRQGGAIGLFGILTLLTALLFTALAVDAGRLWIERRQLQSIADLAALEAARSLGCAGDIENALAAAQEAATRNGFTGNLNNAPNLLQVGGLNTVAGKRQFAAGTGNEAVHVTATRTVPASLVLGGFFGQNTLISAQATARGEPSHATFTAGSYLLRISTTPEDAGLLNGLLGGLLGSSLALDAISYKGLASTDVNLAQLVRAGAGVGSVEELLDANLSVADIIGLTATAVSQQSGVDAAVTAGLQQLLAASVNNAAVRLGDVLDVSVPASDAAGKVGINVFDLITTTLMVANKQHAVSLPLAINLGSLINVNARINVIEPPQIAVGPPGQDAAGNWCTQARTAQIDVTAAVKVDVLLARIDLGLQTQVAQGEAHLESLSVAPGATRAVIGATPGIATIKLTKADGSGHGALISALGGLIPLAEIGLDLPVQPGNPSQLVYDVANPVSEHLPLNHSLASPLGDSLATTLADPAALDIKVLGLDLGGVLSPVLSQVVSPLLGFIGSAVLDPLLRLLGLQLGGLDVTLEDVEYTGGARLAI